ncbi:IS4 family transposase [Scytonema hofmannii]|nr:IS4 family transposase [Scytonema hofmannii]
MTAETVAESDVMLCVGDTTFLDYGSIESKKEGYGPIGKGGNGLILHSALAIKPESGQSVGLLWQKLWNREPKKKPPKNETPAKKKIRLATARIEARKRPFEDKESYRWLEALTIVESLVSKHTRVVHTFDREGDITEVFDKVRQLQHTGVIIRAAHNRSLDSESERLWSKLEGQPISLEQEIELPQTSKRSARKTKLAVRFCPVNLRTPYRFDNRDPLLVYAVYATEVDCPEGETSVEWMLLTTEVVADIQTASMILRWYSYRWIGRW